LLGLTVIIAYFALIFGELVPKRMALQSTEAIALSLATPLSIIVKFFRPLIWLLSHSSDLILRAIGIDPKASREAISEEELVDLVTGHKALTNEEREIVEEVFNASDRQLHEVMVPRTEVYFLEASLTLAEAVSFALEQGHSRYPVTRGSSDEVIGFIHVRDLLAAQNSGEKKSVLELVRPMISLCQVLKVCSNAFRDASKPSANCHSFR